MKCITVCQPFADALMGPKRVENRPRVMNYRGPLLIHAGKSRTFLGSLTAEQLAAWPQYTESYRFGYILGAVDVIDCLTLERYLAARLARGEQEPDPWAVGPYCIITANPRRLVKPIPWSGSLGLFEVGEATLRDVEWEVVA